MNNIGRRQLAAAGACAGLGMILADRFLGGAGFHDRRKPRSHVAVVEADSYDDRLENLLLPSIRALAGHLPGKTILLKPNLVEDLPGPVNTHPAVVRAAARCFLNLGAKRVIVGEGPGNQRDSEAVLAASGLVPELRSIGVQFVDLNRDALSPVKLKTNFSGLKRLWLPQTLLAADFVVSVPKVKTTWNITNSHEYGFYSNVNPQVDHPRWSQGTERRLGELRRRPTLMFNGYGDQVAQLYAGMDLKKNF
jgi:hypothetical protein